MAEETQVSIDTLPMAEFKEARSKGILMVDKPAETEQPEEEKKEEQPAPKKHGGGFQKKIDRLIKMNATAEERAAALEKEVETLRSKNGTKPEEAKPKGDDEPKREDFTDDAAWVKAQARWEVRQELRQEREAEQKAAEEAEVKAIFDGHNRRVAETRAKYDDFDEKVNATDTPWKDGTPADVRASQAFQVALFETDNSGEILYHLASHPEELAKFAGLSPVKIQMAMGRLADKIGHAEPEEEEEEEQEEQKPAEEEKPKKPVSKAPTPIKPVGGSSTKSSVPLDSMNMADYKKARAAGRVQ